MIYYKKLSRFGSSCIKIVFREKEVQSVFVPVFERIYAYLKIIKEVVRNVNKQ